MSDMSVKKSSGFAETVRTVVYAVLIAIVIRTFAYEPFNIPSGSMIPTLLIGDYLFVSKMSYGYSRHSLPFSRRWSRDIWSTPPERGDVAVFKLPTDGKTDYIKRIIGLPGDRLQVVGGILRINGEAVRRERIEDDLAGSGSDTAYAQYIETLPNGVAHRIIERSDDASLDNTGVYVVRLITLRWATAGQLAGQPRIGAVGFIPAANLAAAPKSCSSRPTAAPACGSLVARRDPLWRLFDPVDDRRGERGSGGGDLADAPGTLRPAGPAHTPGPSSMRPPRAGRGAALASANLRHVEAVARRLAKPGPAVA
jgi:signal peptidase I